MIPAWLIALSYFTASMVLVFTVRADFRWVSPPRLFLAAALFGWAVFYTLIATDTATFDTLRVLSRWLHLPVAVGVILIAGSRWYHERQWRNGE